MSQLLRDENGQAVVEYVLMLTVALSVLTIMAVGFRRMVLTLWEAFTARIAAPSPLQPPDGRYRFR